LLFFVFSFLTWFFFSLSSNYEGFTNFKLTINNENKSEISSELEKIKIKSKTYLFIYYNLFPKNLVLQTPDIVCKNNKCFIILDQNTLQALQKQSLNATFLEFEKDTLFLTIKNKFHKKVKVISHVNIEPKKGYLLDNPIKIQPDSVIVFGEKEALSKINFVSTPTLYFKKVSGTFEQKIPLVLDKQFVNKVIVNVDHVNFSAYFSKYTEIEVELPIQIFDETLLNNTQIIPNKAIVYLLIKLENVDKINSQEFKLQAFYDPKTKTKQKAILKLVEKPDFVLSYRVIPAYADFIKKN